MKNKVSAWVAILTAFCVRVCAETVYQDDFSGKAGTALNGAALDVGGAAWKSGANFKSDGSFNATQANGSAYLPLKIEPGKIYTASLDVTVLSAEKDMFWAGVGFADDVCSVAANPLGAAEHSAATLTLRGNGALVAYHNTKPICNIPGDASLTTLRMVLTTYADATPWRVDFYRNDKQIATYTFTEVPNITRISIGAGGAGAISGDFNGFKVEVTSSAIRIVG